MSTISGLNNNNTEKNVINNISKWMVQAKKHMIKEEYDQAFPIYKKIFDQNLPSRLPETLNVLYTKSRTDFAYFYFKGVGGAEKDRIKARALTTLSAKEGHARAQLNLARYLVAKGERKEAIDWYKAAEAQGEPKAIQELSTLNNIDTTKTIDQNQSNRITSPSFPYELLEFVDKDKKNLKELMKIVQSMNQKGHRINIFEKENRIFLNHTRQEIDAWIATNNDLHPYFYVRNKDIFNGYFSENGIRTENYLQRSDDLAFWESKLRSTHAEKSPICGLPDIPSFSGSQNEIALLLTSLLKDQRGLIIGERAHNNQSPKQVLIHQMPHLYALGVRTLFLEHCCFDTLQPELDHFYNTKTPSQFLQNFLSHGYGYSVGNNNYFDVVKAAVDAGIRPVALETSATQMIGYDSYKGSHGGQRMIAMNMCGQEIIARETQGKYIALVGAGHNSYCYGIPGLSELCQVPSLAIGDAKETKNVAYSQNCINLNFSEEDIKEFINNPEGKKHFVNAYIQAKPYSTASGSFVHVDKKMDK